VFLTGWRDDVRDLMAIADAFVLPSWREGVPRAAMEAAAMGLPMVLTDIRGCREVGSHGSEALLVPPRDPRALTEALETLLGDPALRRRLGAAARTRALERFDNARVHREIASSYRALLNGEPRRQAPGRTQKAITAY
jgi:glycosyltransferase involved in cell wall biosynthesis